MKYMPIAQSGIIALALALGACGDSSHTTNTATPIAGSHLKRVASEQELTTYIRTIMLERYGVVREMLLPLGAVDDGATPSAAPTATSTTNTQETGVDEADRIKTNGSQLFVASSEKPALLVFNTDRASNSKVAEIALDTENDALLNGLYLNGSTLTALSSGWNFMAYPMVAAKATAQTTATSPAMIMPPFYAQSPTSQLFMLDVSQATNPQQKNTLKLDGETVSSRMVGSTLYMATRYTPSLTGLVAYPTTEADAAANRALINAASLQDFLPNYATNGQDQGDIFTAADCFMTQYSADSNTASIVSLIAIDTAAASPVPRGQCFVGDTETLYASTEAVYLATTQYRYETDANGWLVYNGTVNTDLHKFALSANAVSYRGSGRVDGHLGWQQDLKPFRLSEYNDTLRVITYTGDNQNTTTSSPAHLYNLQEDATTQSLKIVGQLPNTARPQALGKPGEQIYATRLMGERGYLVTFRTTDPLYILDLSNPTDPFIAGELQIDGYSDYLHPISENLLLGIGKDALAVESTDTGTSSADELTRGAWYQGVKLSMIDVTDLQNPVEKQKIIIGKRGTETTVSQTHHALTTLKNGNNLQVALPISRNEAVDPTYSDANYNPDKPWYYYGWTQDELYTLDIDTSTGTMTPRAPLVSATASTDTNYSYQWPNDRSVMIGGYVHYLHGDQVISRAW